MEEEPEIGGGLAAGGVEPLGPIEVLGLSPWHSHGHGHGDDQKN